MEKLEKALARVASVAKQREKATRQLESADIAFRTAVLAAYQRGASLRAIRDASGRTISHEGVRRIIAAAQERGIDGSS